MMIIIIIRILPTRSYGRFTLHTARISRNFAKLFNYCLYTAAGACVLGVSETKALLDQQDAN